MSDGMIALLAFFIVAVLPSICILLVAVPAIKADKARKRGNVIFNKYTNTLTVHYRQPSNRKLLYSRRASVMYNEYVPASATFTAATVGGVTTGGWDFKEEHYDTKAGSKTNRYYIIYKDNIKKKDHFIVNKIDLSPKDAVFAKKNPCLVQFLQGNTLVLKHAINSNNTSAAKRAFQSTGDFYAASNLLANDIAYSNLTENEAAEIINFVCGE